jgi:hypothetical protein
MPFAIVRNNALRGLTSLESIFSRVNAKPQGVRHQVLLSFRFLVRCENTNARSLLTGMGAVVNKGLASSANIRFQVRQLLGRSEPDVEAEWGALPARKAINALFPHLYSTDQQRKCRAVQALGLLVARLAEQDLEAARNVVRRLIWNLNDESGGIGWGSAEAMGEIVAGHAQLGDEYSQILLSYARVDGNLLEHDGLLAGVLWGLGRVAACRPELLSGAAEALTIHLQSRDLDVRAQTVKLLGMLGDAGVREQLGQLADDLGEVMQLEGGTAKLVRIAELVAEALARIDMQQQVASIRRQI